MIEEGIIRYWSANEVVSTKVYTPLLADYMVLSLIIASALLFTGIAIPVHNTLHKNVNEAKKVSTV